MPQCAELSNREYINSKLKRPGYGKQNPYLINIYETKIAA